MTRRVFGEQVQIHGSNPGATVKAYLAPFGGDPVEIADADGNVIGSGTLTLVNDVVPIFQGPNDGTATLWLDTVRDTGDGRVKTTATDAAPAQSATSEGVGDRIEVYRNAPDVVSGASSSLTFTGDDGNTVGTSLSLEVDGTVLVNEDGIYAVTAFARFDANATGRRVLALGSSSWMEGVEASSPGLAGVQTTVSVHMTHFVPAGDTIDLIAGQDSGGDLDAYMAMTVIRLA